MNEATVDELIERLLARDDTAVSLSSDASHSLAEQSVKILGLSTRVTNALERGGIQTVGELLASRPEELDRLRNLGMRSREAISSSLEARGLHLQGEKPGAIRRRHAAEALGRMGIEAERAISGLGAAVRNDPVLDVRKVATEALARIGQEAGKAVAVVPTLVAAALHDDSRQLRRVAAIGLGRLGADAQEGVASLIDTMRGAEVPLYDIIWESLAMIGAPAVAQLLNAATDLDPTVREGAIRALARIRPRPGQLPVVLRRALGDPAWRVRQYAIIGLQRLGNDARDAVADLIEVLENPGEHAKLRGDAALALARIGPQAKPAISSLTNVLSDPRPNVRIRATAALASIGADIRAVQPLIGVLDHGTVPSRSDAARALGTIGPDAKEAVSALCRALRSDTEYVRSSAAEALGRIGPDAWEAVPDLVRVLEDFCQTNAQRYSWKQCLAVDVIKALGCIEPQLAQDANAMHLMSLGLLSRERALGILAKARPLAGLKPDGTKC